MEYNEAVRDHFERTGEVPKGPLDTSDPGGPISEDPDDDFRNILPVDSPVRNRAAFSRTVDPDEAGRDDSPTFQRAYEALKGPFVPVPERPTFIPGPGQGFPPANVPEGPVVTPPAPPTTVVPPPIPDSLGDLGLRFNGNDLLNGMLRVSSVSGPLDDLGLNEGDILLAVNGQRVASEQGLLNTLFDSNVFNEEVTMEVFRDGAFVEFSFVPSQAFDDLLDD